MTKSIQIENQEETPNDPRQVQVDNYCSCQYYWVSKDRTERNDWKVRDSEAEPNQVNLHSDVRDVPVGSSVDVLRILNWI